MENPCTKICRQTLLVSFPLVPSLALLTVLLESILATRLETIRKLLALPYDYLKRYEHDSPHLCRIPKDEVACKAVIYGSLIHQLQVYKLWPPVRPESVNLSVYNLGSQICRLTITF